MKFILRLFFLFFLMTLSFSGYATHNRAGEITYEFVGANAQDLTYKVTITTYTKTSSIQADRPSLPDVAWGDGSTATFVRSIKTDLPNDISVNTYINSHTYAGNGSYLISFTDPNRNAN